jgi:hypothetical protein
MPGLKRDIGHISNGVINDFSSGPQPIVEALDMVIVGAGVSAHTIMGLPLI